MPNPQWGKRKTDEPIWQGPRISDGSELITSEGWFKEHIEEILDAMNRSEFIIFNYDGSDRVVAPFVVGVSSEGKALLRGYQIWGNSRSGKGEGWRVFQIPKITYLANFWEFFEAGQFLFDPFYPWTYKVFQMI